MDNNIAIVLIISVVIIVLYIGYNSNEKYCDTCNIKPKCGNPNCKCLNCMYGLKNSCMDINCSCKNCKDKENRKKHDYSKCHHFHNEMLKNNMHLNNQ